MIYFDNSATTKPCDEVIKSFNDDLINDRWGNPGSLHKLGIISSDLYEKALDDCAGVLNCQPSELIFTSCGTESANTAIEGYMRANLKKGRTIISTRTEHKCTLNSLLLLQKEGFIVKFVNVNSDGKPDLNELRDLIDCDTVLLCFTHVNNETGSVLPLQQIVNMRKDLCPDAAIYLDCVQSLGKLPVNLKNMGIDMASSSGHKIHGIKGTGLLYIRKGIKINPLIVGGGQQEGRRSGTQSLPLASSFTCALKLAEKGREEAYKNANAINSYLRGELIKRGVTINSPSDALPFVLNAAFPNFQSETMLHCLEMYDIYISTVSACASRSKKTSYVLEAMGIDKKTASNSVRLSFSRYNTIDEAKLFIETLDEIIRLYEVKVR